MIPQLQQLCEGYNELEKIETLKKHFKYFVERQQQPQQPSEKENFIRKIAEEYLTIESKYEDPQKLNQILSSLEDEKQIMLKRQQLLPKNIEYELVNQIIILIDQLKQLYNEKIQLQQQNQNQQEIISNLLNQVYNLNKEFTIKMQELSKYNNQIPNEREMILQKENQQLKQDLQKYEQFDHNLNYVKQLLLQAENTKVMLQQSLREYKNY